jgi:hypothetical protein
MRHGVHVTVKMKYDYSGGELEIPVSSRYTCRALIQWRLSTEEITDLATECIGEKDNGGKPDVATRVAAQEPTRTPCVHRGGTTFTFCSLRNENIPFVAVSRGAACSTITPSQITRAADHHHRVDDVALDDPSAGSIYEAQGR